MNEVFGVELKEYEHPSGQYRGAPARSTSRRNCRTWSKVSLAWIIVHRPSRIFVGGMGAVASVPLP